MRLRPTTKTCSAVPVGTSANTLLTDGRVSDNGKVTGPVSHGWIVEAFPDSQAAALGLCPSVKTDREASRESHKGRTKGSGQGRCADAGSFQGCQLNTQR
jgi:hypothetical protein